MPKILSFNLYKEKDNETPFGIILDSFKSLDRFTKITVITLLLIIFSTPFIVGNLLIFNPKAQESGIEVNALPPSSEPEFVTNELLIKVKKESRGKVRENPGSTGIASLDRQNIGKESNGKFDYKVKGFEKIAKAGKNSNADHELFNWYLLSLDAPNEVVTGKLDSALNVIESNPSNTNSNGFKNGENPAIDNLQRLIDDLKEDPDVEEISLNYVVSTQAIPNDPYYSSIGSWGQVYPDLWGMKKINAESAWDQSTGSATIIVADIDTGVDRNHPDLASNMWVNSNETPNNGIDDDNNGYKDDYYGWDYVNNDNDPMDDHGHGTHTVGTIAGVGNNGIGVVGVNWTSKIMALKFLSSTGSGDLSNGIRALQYAADMGARVSSNSWGCACNSSAMDDAIKYEHDKGMVMVAAAGNSNVDAVGFSPASADYAVTVAASDSNDTKASFSNWGEKIDVSAPGVDILSTRASNNPMCTAARTVGTSYCRVSGTSMATPHVAGLAALLLSKNPNLTNEEVRQILRNGADDLGTLGKDKDYGYGRINAFGTLNLSDSHPLTPVITSPSSRTIVNSSSINIIGKIGGPNFASYKLEYGSGRVPTAWIILANSTTQPTTATTLHTLDTTKLAEGTYTIRLSATDTTGKTYQFQIFDLNVDNFDVAITYPTGLVSLSSVDLIGTALAKNGVTFDNYKIEWTPTSSSTSWSTTGITLANGGSQSVTNGKLGTWDTTTLIFGQAYYLRLTATGSNGLSFQVQVRIQGDKDLIIGWPKYLDKPYTSSIITPIITDIDGDGKKDVVYAAPDNKVYAYHKDGTSLPGFPVLLITNASVSYSPIVRINVDDLDGDGKKEIIAMGFNGTNRYTYVVKSDGKFYPGWPQTNYVDQPAIADLDRDGVKEIVSMEVKTYSTNTSLKLHAYHLNGSEIVGFPKSYTLPPVGLGDGFIFNSFSSGLSIADLDRDGNLEIAWSFSNRIYLFDNNGNILPGWPFIVPNYNNRIMKFESPHSIGDIDGDGNLELFSISGLSCSQTSYTCYIGGDTVFYGFKKDGSVLTNWPHTTLTDNIKSHGDSISLADIDNDGKDEIIMGGNPMMIFDETGKKALTSAPSLYTQPALSDIDGNGKLEYQSTFSNKISIVSENGISFTTFWQRIINDNVFATSQAIGDMDNDGKMELLAVDRPRGYSSTGLIGGLNSIYLWEIPNSSGNANYEWPMFGHDPARTGRLLLGPQLPTPTLGPTSIPTPTPASSLTPTPVPGDNTPPTTSITGPLNAITIARKSTVTIIANASDNVGVAKVEFYVNGDLKCVDTSVSYSCIWSVPAPPNKIYQLQTKAYDASFNSSSSSIVTVTAK